MKLDQELESGQGFSQDYKFLPEELHAVKKSIRDHWLAQIKLNAPDAYHLFNSIDINEYHNYSHLLQHNQLWCKANRILPATTVEMIRSTSLVKALEQHYGPFKISNEEGLLSEEIYWRLVRPNQPDDMGPIHADCWFWDLGHGTTPEHCKRVKIWIALWCEPQLNGLRLVPYSQKQDWRYHGEFRDGFLKPQLDEEEDNLDIELMLTHPGEAIVFHDKLLHGGALNRGQFTRVSIEFTMFVEK